MHLQTFTNDATDSMASLMHTRTYTCFVHNGKAFILLHSPHHVLVLYLTH